MSVAHATGHDRVKMEEVERHLDQTHVVWHGGIEEDSTFYYRIHSPVVLIEFEHLRGVSFDNDEPARTHIHSILRTRTATATGRGLTASTPREPALTRVGQGSGIRPTPLAATRYTSDRGPLVREARCTSVRCLSSFGAGC